MPKRTRVREKTLPRLRDTSKTLSRLNSRDIAEALGAEPCRKLRDQIAGPLSLFAVRQELAGRLQSTGGRPALEGTSRRVKIPLSDQQWLRLEEIAAALAAPGFAPTAGQLASVLLELSIQSLTHDRRAS